MKKKYLLLFVIATALLQGCLVTTGTSFNNGKVLSPGNARGSIGFGRRIAHGYQKIETPNNQFVGHEYYIDTTYSMTKDDSTYTDATFLLHSFAFDFQLGISKKFPFGKGLNIGFHRELPGYSFRKNIFLIPTSELTVKCGFKDKPMARFTYNHNMMFGWQRGLYVDNGFFMEYAGGFETLKRKIPYFNVRLGFTPTNPLEKFDDFDPFFGENDTFFTYRNKQFFGRLCLGNTFVPQRKRPIVPEIFTEASFNFIQRKKVYPTFQVGLSWKSFFNEK